MSVDFKCFYFKRAGYKRLKRDALKYTKLGISRLVFFWDSSEVNTGSAQAEKGIYKGYDNRNTLNNTKFYAFLLVSLRLQTGEVARGI